MLWISSVCCFQPIWTFERRRQGQLTTVARKRIYLAVESGKVILLGFIVARCVWKGFDLANKATVNGLAQKALFGSPAPAAAHYVTNYSFGPAGIPVPVPQKIRVKAWVLAFIAVLFIAITYALFNG
jgi:hypothetical protein